MRTSPRADRVANHSRTIRKRVETMLNVTRNRLVGVWFAAVAITIASVVATGVNVGISTTALLLTLCAVPPGIIFVLWRGASTQTIGEILYAEHTGPEGRR
jgi:hypothetical protein